MDPETSKIVDALTKISIPVWDAYIFQMKVRGFLMIFFGLASMFIGVVCGDQFVKLPAKDPRDSEEFTSKDGYAISTIVFLLFGLILFFFGIFYLVNPTYYAVQTLIGR
jgi:Mn2+/Fe2+ NRAMP family transporter